MKVITYVASCVCLVDIPDRLSFFPVLLPCSIIVGKSNMPVVKLGCWWLRLSWDYYKVVYGRSIEVLGCLEGVFSIIGALLLVIIVNHSA